MVEQDLYNLLRESLVHLESGGHAALQNFDLTAAHYDALRLLSLDEGQRMGELGRRLLCDNSKTTRIVDHLAARGLAERRQDAADRRAWLVFLTPAGAALRDRALIAHHAYLQAQFAILSTHEQAQLVQLLGRLRQHLASGGPSHD
jgi:DNA-binding MarR family transcriptional regulator